MKTEKKQIFKRLSFLRKRSGSTLVEAVSGLLVVSLALGVFYAGYRVASNIYLFSLENLDKNAALLETYYTDPDAGVLLDGDVNIFIWEDGKEGEAIELTDPALARPLSMYRVTSEGRSLDYFVEPSALGGTP